MSFSLWSFFVVRTLFLSTLLTAVAVVPVSAGPGLFGSKPKPDAARVRTLVETLKSDPDEKRRKAAAAELGWADGRVIPEVAPALAAALQKDASAVVRAEAADALAQLKQVFPLAGMALETAAANDPAPSVRLAAKIALWEYHLNGYRSPRSSDGFATQTVEPPIASPAPAGSRTASAVMPAPPLPPYVAPLPAEPPTKVSYLPPVAPPNGPRVIRTSLFGDLLPGPQAPIRALIGATPPPILNVTNEPPFAKPVVSVAPLPVPAAPLPTLTSATAPEPTLSPVHPPTPDYVPSLPPFMPDLPPVVTSPDEAPPAPEPVPQPKIPATLPPLPK